MAVVDLINIRKNFGSVAALDGIDLRIEDGENVAILGPSGSGKSTLLRVISGLEDLDDGEVRFDGVSQHGVPAHKRDAAIVFQHFALYPHLSSLENITLGLRHGLGLSKAEANGRAREIAQRMRVENLLDRKPKEMSGGQRQRIALARALARRSGLVLLDEPLSGLDAQLHAALRLEIASLLRSVGATGINVTHDQLDAMAMSDRIAVLNAGRIEQVGTPDELYARPETLFVAGFVGSPPMSLIETADDDSVFGHFTHSTGERLTFGVRAEDFGLATASGAHGAWTAAGIVGLIEPTGKDRVVRIICDDGTTLALRTSVEDTPAAGSRVLAACRAEDVHVYSTATGRRLGSAASAGVTLSASVAA